MTNMHIRAIDPSQSDAAITPSRPFPCQPRPVTPDIAPERQAEVLFAQASVTRRATGAGRPAQITGTSGKLTAVSVQDPASQP
jgi:hypothetical protein